jgi:O-antigen/teichoic acid export membrane protein
VRFVSFAWLAPFLNTLGQRLGINAHHYAKQSAIVTLSHIINTVKGIITGYLVTRLFPQEMYGMYQFVGSVMGIIGIIGIGSVSTAMARSIAKDGTSAPITNTVARHVAICLIGSAILLICIPCLAWWNRSELWPLFAIASLLFVPSQVGTALFGALITGTGRFHIATKATFVSAILLSASVVSMLFIQPSATILLALTTGIPALVALGFSATLLKQYPSVQSGKQLIRYGFQLSLTGIPSAIAWHADKLILGHYVGLNQLAIFSVSMLIPEQVKIWTKELFPIAFTAQAKGNDSWERRRHLMKMVSLSTLAMSLPIAVYVLASSWLMPILFPKYPSQILSLLTSISAISLLAAPASLITQYLEARKNVHALWQSNIWSSIFYLTTLLVLIPMYGVVGAALARALLRASTVVFSWWFLIRSPVENTPTPKL